MALKIAVNCPIGLQCIWQVDIRYFARILIKLCWHSELFHSVIQIVMPDVEINCISTQVLHISTQEGMLDVMCLYDGVV